MVSSIFLLAAKFMCALGDIKAEQNTSSTRRNITQLERKNIRESILNFTARFGETNPDLPYLCREILSRGKREVLPLLCIITRHMSIHPVPKVFIHSPPK